jgi:hypothetical protein
MRRKRTWTRDVGWDCLSGSNTLGDPSLVVGGLVLGLLHPVELPFRAPRFPSIGLIIIDF